MFIIFPRFLLPIKMNLGVSVAGAEVDWDVTPCAIAYAVCRAAKVLFRQFCGHCSRAADRILTICIPQLSSQCFVNDRSTCGKLHVIALNTWSILSRCRPLGPRRSLARSRGGLLTALDIRHLPPPIGSATPTIACPCAELCTLHKSSRRSWLLVIP